MMLSLEKISKNFQDAFGCPFSSQTAETCFQLAREQIEGVQPLTLSKISAIYEVLFQPPFDQTSQRYLDDTYHPARIVQRLYLVTEPYKKSKKFQTESFDGQRGALGLKGTLKGMSSVLVIFKEGVALAKREQVAYLMDKGHRVGVRPTVLLKLPRLGEGSGQLFEANCRPINYRTADRLSLQAPLRQISIFNTRLLNQDGHAGNILVNGTGDVFPIDHGDSLPSSNTAPFANNEMFEDVGQEPFTLEECHQIEELEDDSKLLEKHQFDENTIFQHQVATKLLKTAASRVQVGVNLSPFDLNVIRHTTEMRAARPSVLACTPNAPTRLGLTRFQQICANRTDVDNQVNTALDEIVQIKHGFANPVGMQDSTQRAIQKIFSNISASRPIPEKPVSIGGLSGMPKPEDSGAPIIILQEGNPILVGILRHLPQIANVI